LLVSTSNILATAAVSTNDLESVIGAELMVDVAGLPGGVGAAGEEVG